MPAGVLIDIGANLSHDSFSHDREAVIARAVEAGVAAMIVTGSSLADSGRALTLGRSLPARLRATAGVHPHHASGFREDDIPALGALLADPLVVAAGECGLDYFRNFSAPADQRRAFAWQLAEAERHGKPLFLHQRQAHADFLSMLADHRALAARSVLHCFTDGPREAEDCLAIGLSLGITGWVCDERRGGPLREAVARIPADRLLLETDAPYLLPRTLSAKPAHRRNEPGYLPAVLEELARCRGEDPAAVAVQTTANACRLFGLTLSGAPGGGDARSVSLQ